MEAMDVLVVEDSPEYLQIVTAVLKQSGHRVRAATSIADALESMSSVPPDLVVLDLTLPRRRRARPLPNHTRALICLHLDAHGP